MFIYNLEMFQAIKAHFVTKDDEKLDELLLSDIQLNETVSDTECSVQQIDDVQHTLVVRCLTSGMQYEDSIGDSSDQYNYIKNLLHKINLSYACMQTTDYADEYMNYHKIMEQAMALISQW